MYNDKSDIWSCGVILYMMLCGYTPFNGNNNDEIKQKIIEGNVMFDTEEW